MSYDGKARMEELAMMRFVERSKLEEQRLEQGEITQLEFVERMSDAGVELGIMHSEVDLATGQKRYWMTPEVREAVNRMGWAG